MSRRARLVDRVVSIKGLFCRSMGCCVKVLMLPTSSTQEWAATALKLRLFFLHGQSEPKAEQMPSYQLPEKPPDEAIQWPRVFIWAHVNKDPAGSGADHFSYFCQEKGGC